MECILNKIRVGVSIVILFLFVIPVFAIYPTSLMGECYSHVEDNKAYIFSLHPYSLRGMSLMGVGYWDDHLMYLENPAAISFIDDYTALPVLNIGYDISENNRYFYKIVKDNADLQDNVILSSSELQELWENRCYLRSSWSPFNFKKGNWSFAIASSLLQEIYLGQMDSTQSTQDSVVTDVYSSYRSDIGVRIGHAKEVYTSEQLQFSLGYNLNIVFSASSDSILHKPNENYANYLNPIPGNIKSMETMVGYAFDFGAGLLIHPLHLQYSLFIEEALGQLYYTRTHPLYHMGIGWELFMPDSLVHNINVKAGLEFYRMGELDFGESVQLGTEIEFHNIFLRTGYSDLGASIGAGIKLNRMYIQYAYFPEKYTKTGMTNYRHGVEFYVRL